MQYVLQRKKTTSLVLKKKNAEPKGNVGNKHEHMVHVKKYITMKFYERCPTSCVKEMQMSFLIY